MLLGVLPELTAWLFGCSGHAAKMPADFVSLTNSTAKEWLLGFVPWVLAWRFVHLRAGMRLLPPSHSPGALPHLPAHALSSGGWVSLTLHLYGS